MRKKILYLITKSNWGGAQRYVYDLASNLPRERFEVAVACGGSGVLVKKLTEAGIRTLSLEWLERDVGFWKELRAFAEILRLLKKERPDILHLNSPKAGGLGGLAAFFSKFQVPSSKFQVLYTVHGWPFREDRPFWQKALIFWGSWISPLFWNKVILVSRADLKSAGRFIPRRKLVFIPNGVAAIDFLPRKDARAFFAQRIARLITNDTILIGTIAELTKNKGLLYLIDAINQVRIRNYELGIRVLIIGGGEQREELEKRIQNLGLTQKIFLPGFVPEASRYLTGLDIFVLPSVKEGLPYALMEAMAAGLPAVATAVGGMPDLIQSDKNGILIAPKNSLALAEALARLMERPEERTRLGREAQKTIAERFALADMTGHTITIYESFASHQ